MVYLDLIDSGTVQGEKSNIMQEGDYLNHRLGFTLF